MQNNFHLSFKNPSNFRGVFYLLLFFVSINTFGQAILKFKDTKKSFGIVKKGDVVKLKFEFTNVGNEPLLIFDVKAGCSCTQIEFPKTPILPNETSELIVIFDTKTVYDRQDRIVEVISNSKINIQKIRFKGIVLNK